MDLTKKVREPESTVSIVGGNAGPTPIRASLAARRSAQLPKLKDIRRRPDSLEEGGNGEANEGDLEMEYGDADPSFGAELSEIYAYSELPEFRLNLAAWVAAWGSVDGWWEATEAKRRAFIQRLLSEIEAAETERRSQAIRSLLYLLQGSFGSAETESEVLWSGVRSAYLLFEEGAYQSFCSLLAAEAAIAEEEDEKVAKERREAAAEGVDHGGRVGGRPTWAQPSIVTKRSGSVTIADSEQLRLCLSALLHLVESLRREGLGELGAATALPEVQAILLFSTCPFLSQASSVVSVERR